MLEGLLFDRTKQPLMQKALDAYALRLKTTANNISNVSTHGYERKEVKFEEKLSDALNNPSLSGSITSSQHMKLGKDNLDELEPEVSVPQDEFTNGVNNVNIDHEMLELGKVQINNTFIMRSMSGFFGTLDAAIKGQRTR